MKNPKQETNQSDRLVKAFFFDISRCFLCSVAGILLLLLGFRVAELITHATFSMSNDFYGTLMPFYLVIGTGISFATAAITRYYFLIAPIIVALLIYLTIPSVTA